MRPLQAGLSQLDPASSKSQQQPLPLAETQPDNAPASRSGSPSNNKEAQRDPAQGSHNRQAEALQVQQAAVNRGNHLDEALHPHRVESEPAMLASPPSASVDPSGMRAQDVDGENFKRFAAGMPQSHDTSQAAASSQQPDAWHEEQASRTLPNITYASDAAFGLPRVPAVDSEHGLHGLPQAWRTGSPSVASDVSSRMGPLDFLSVEEPEQLADEDMTHFDIPLQREHPVPLSTAGAGNPSAHPLAGASSSAVVSPSAEPLPRGVANENRAAAGVQGLHSGALASAEVQSSKAENSQSRSGVKDRSGPMDTGISPPGSRSSLLVSSNSPTQAVENPPATAMHQQSEGLAQSGSSQTGDHELYQELLQTLRSTRSADAIEFYGLWSDLDLAEVFARDMEDEIMLLLAKAFKVRQCQRAMN